MSDIIITGAGQGIGYYMAEKLLIDGNRIADLIFILMILKTCKSDLKI